VTTGDGVDRPRATVVVVPRGETVGQVRVALETLVANTRSPYHLVIVDGGYPASTRQWVEAFAQARDATLLRAKCLLSPNEARNIALAFVTTEFVVFLDDNCFVREGWLDALVACADETGAAIVGPLYGFRSGRDSAETVHVFGAEARIDVDGDRRSLVDRHFHAGMPLDEAIATFSRMPTESVEFHCMLVRTALFGELGPLDEGLLSTSEHLDICMQARAAGHEVWAEPASVVVYELPLPLPRADRPGYVLRWCEEWNRASYERLAQKWDINDLDGLAQVGKFADDRRYVAYKLSPPLLDRALNRFGGRPRRALDRMAQAWIVPRETRRRVRHPGATVVRTASWQQADPVAGPAPSISPV
jgi:glycosyltransferase involved in cell wall biosynthesis